MAGLLLARGITSPSEVRNLPIPGHGALVLSLDFWTSRSLAAASTPFRTPAEFLDGADFALLDKTALEMAQDWHKPIAGRLTYHGVPLGEMAEAEFIGLFVDAVRSVEVAHRLLSAEAPETIHLPPPGPASEPVGLCYATLPRVLEVLARQRGIAVKPTAGGNVARGPGFLSTTLRECRNLVQTADSLRRPGPKSPRAGRGTVLFLDQAGFDSVASSLEDRGFRCRLALPTWRWDVRSAAERARLADLGHQLLQEGPFFDRLSYRGVPVLEVARPWIAWFLRRRAAELAGIVERFEALARHQRPVAVVTLQDVSPDCRTVARLCRGLGIPVVVVQHGAVSADMGGFHVLPKEGEVQAVWGEASRDWHLARGKPPESQVVTGNPRFDGLPSYRSAGRADVLRSLGLDPSRRMALLAAEWFSGTASAYTLDAEEAVLVGVLRELQRVPALQVVLKLHPTHQRETAPRIAEIVREAGSEAVVARDRLWDWLAAADVVLVFNSTVGVEALLFDKPLIAIEYFPRAEKIPYVAWGTALGVQEPRDLVPMVTRALSDEPARQALRAARQAMLDRIVFARDGRSADRVADLVARLGGTAVQGTALGRTERRRRRTSGTYK